jgi:Uma2 family endonuclease
VIEVLSKSTESYDRGFKFESYRRLSSCREYILISQTKPLVERFVKQPDGSWVMTVVEGLDEQLTIESVPISVPLRTLYRDMVFPPRLSPAPTPDA